MLHSLIRPMERSDLDDVCHLYEEANPFTDFETILKWTKRSLELFPDLHWVFESDWRIVGAISGIEEAEGGHIEDIAVAKELRKQGIGSQLIHHLIDQFERIGVRNIGLWVHEKNGDALPFYEKNGFRKIGEQLTKDIPDVPDGEKIMIMGRKLER